MLRLLICGTVHLNEYLGLFSQDMSEMNRLIKVMVCCDSTAQRMP